MEQKKDSILQSVDNALSMIELLSDQPSIGPAQAAKALGIGKSTAFRLLHTLESRGFARKDENAKYRLGLKIAELGSKVIQSFDIVGIAHPFLEKFCQHVGETVHLVVLTEDRNACFIDKVISPTTSFRMESNIGSHKPAYVTGTGKVLLAHQPLEYIDSYLSETEFIQYTDTTVTDPQMLSSILHGIRANGFGVDNGESEEGLYCIAAPVFNRAQIAIAAVSASGPKERMAGKQDMIISHLLDICANISREL